MTQPRAETSRHRSAPRAPIAAAPDTTGWTLRRAAPVGSLVLIVAVTAAVQLLSTVAQRVPSGAARFETAGAWLASAPDALAGSGGWWTAPVLGRLQLGVLLRLVQGAEGGPVLVAAQHLLLALAVAQAVLLWLLLRRTGRGPAAAGLATAVSAVAPAAIAVHASVSTAGIAVVWLLVAGLLLVPAGGRYRGVAGGAAAALAVVTHPLALVPVAVAAAAAALAGRSPQPVRAVALRGPVVGLLSGLALVAAFALVCASLPQTAAARALDAVSAAQPPLAAGVGALALWLGADPLGVVVALVALVVVLRTGSTRAVGVAALLLVAASIWPAGADGVAPLVLLLPVAAVAVALTVDAAVAALGHPVFVRSLIGSGWLMGVAALLLVAVVVSLSGLRVLLPAEQRPLDRVGRWLQGSVPADQTVLVDLGVWPDLQRATTARVGWYAAGGGSAVPPSSLPWTEADYVVTDAAGGAAGAVAARSALVARFGTGDGSLAVRAVQGAAQPAVPAAPDPATTPGPATSAQRDAAAARLQAGRQLAGNSRIELDGEDRALLIAGRVDTRLALVLAQFATSSRVTVAAFGTAAGDRSGVRTTVLISAVGDRAVPSDVQRTGELLRFLSALRGDFATRSIDAGQDGVTASFAPDPAFVPAS